MSTYSSDQLDEVWQKRLAELKATSGLSYQALAARLHMDPSNLYKSIHGKAKVPLPARVHYFDFYGFRSLRSSVLTFLPNEIANSLLAKHDKLLNSNMLKDLRRLPATAEEALKAGDEHPAWMAMLESLKDHYKTDKKLAEELGCSRSMLSMIRSTGQRLPIDLKLRVIDKTDFVVTDELLLSLLPSPVINAIREGAKERPTPENEPALDHRLTE